jgi:uncharacterized FlaG/YvyC family protein
MAIRPIDGSLGLAGVQSPAAESARPSGDKNPDRVQPGAPAQQAKELTKPQSEADLGKLKALASQSGLDVKFDNLPGSNMMVIRIVDPATGKVVREFPPEGLVRALGEMRAEATARLNRRNIDRRA